MPSSSRLTCILDIGARSRESQPTEPESQEWFLLGALAAVSNVRDFHVGEFMTSIDMDARQPALFYRAIVRAAREAVRLKRRLDERSVWDKEAKGEIARLTSSLAEVKGQLRAKERHYDALRLRRAEALQAIRQGHDAELSEANGRAEHAEEILGRLAEFLAGSCDRRVLADLRSIIGDAERASLHLDLNDPAVRSYVNEMRGVVRSLFGL